MEFGYAWLEPGHAGENVAKDGELWLGVFRDGDKFRKAPGKTAVELFEDPLFDSVGEATGETVSFISNPDMSQPPLFLIRGPKLAPGPVVAALGEVSGSESEGRAEINYTLNGQFAGRLTLEFAPKVNDGRRCIYSLEVDGRRTVLAVTDATQPATVQMSAVCPGDEEPDAPHDWVTALQNSVGFAGDLDNDGRLDIELRPPIHYNIGQSGLFLSTAATGEAAVALIGVETRAGC
jgi:hypothetical protein